MGIENIHRFEYLDKPNDTVFVNALHKLYLLNAIDSNGALNESVAYEMMKFPLDPIYSKILIESLQHKAMDIALSLVAIISANNGNSADIFLRPSYNEHTDEKSKYVAMHKQFDSKYGDMISWLLLFNNFLKITGDERRSYEWAKRHFVNLRILKTAKKIRKQLEQIVECEFDSNLVRKQAHKPIKAVRKVLAKSLFFQSALKMEQAYGGGGDSGSNELKGKHVNQRRIVFKVYGNNEYQGNVYIHPSSMSCMEYGDIEWIVYLDILYTSKPFMRGVCAVKYEWIRKLLPKMNDSFAWMNGEEEKKEDCDENKVEDKVAAMTEDELQKLRQAEIEKAKQKQNNIDSVRARYLKRKMLRNELKSL